MFSALLLCLRGGAEVLRPSLYTCHRWRGSAWRRFLSGGSQTCCICKCTRIGTPVPLCRKRQYVLSERLYPQTTRNKQHHSPLQHKLTARLCGDVESNTSSISFQFGSQRGACRPRTLGTGYCYKCDIVYSTV